MPWEISMLPVNSYAPKELVQELIPEKHLLNDAGEIILAQIIFEQEALVGSLIEFLFQTMSSPQEVYRNDDKYILDITIMKERILGYEQLEALYQNWLKISGRENTMDEYGILLDFINAARTKNRQNLLLIVSMKESI